MHGGCVIKRRVFKDPPRPGVFRHLVFGRTNDESARRTTHGRQFDLPGVRGGDKTQVYIDRLARFVRRAADEVRPPFCAIA